MSEQDKPVTVGTIHISMIPEAEEIWAELQRIPTLEARIEVLTDRCERLFRAARTLQGRSALCTDGISAHHDVEAWESFTHDMGVLWRERTGEQIAADSGIFLDG